MHRRGADDLPLYGLDIETDTSRGGLDPTTAGVIAVAVCGDKSRCGTEHVLTVRETGNEYALLAALDDHLSALEPGILVTWNGTRFDLPFIDHRAGVLDLDIGLCLGSGDHYPGSGTCKTAARWYSHTHLDALRAYRHVVGRSGISCALKAVARREGLDPVDEVASSVHLLDTDRLRSYVASDARTARILAERHWEVSARFAEIPALSV